LQPVQLVSIEVRPGVTEKGDGDELALTSPLPQPATSTKAGAKSIGRILEYRRIEKTLFIFYRLHSRKKRSRTARALSFHV
jgi:hypothetical protein